MSKMSKMRVLIVDDHAIVRQGISALLKTEPDIEVVGEAASGEEAVRKTREVQPDVILMDIIMPGMSGLEATREIRQSNPDAKVLVLTMHEGEDYLFSMLEAGASGYFIKGGSIDDLVSALQAVRRGDVFLYPSMAKKLLGDYLQRARANGSEKSYDGLTKREREILKLVAEGYGNQEIGELLSLSASTIQTHRARMMAKLELHSRTELVKYAIRRGFISLDD